MNIFRAVWYKFLGLLLWVAETQPPSKPTIVEEYVRPEPPGENVIFLDDFRKS